MASKETFKNIKTGFQSHLIACLAFKVILVIGSCTSMQLHPTAHYIALELQQKQYKGDQKTALIDVLQCVYTVELYSGWSYEPGWVETVMMTCS